MPSPTSSFSHHLIFLIWGIWHWNFLIPWLLRCIFLTVFPLSLFSLSFTSFFSLTCTSNAVPLSELRSWPSSLLVLYFLWAISSTPMFSKWLKSLPTPCLNSDYYMDYLLGTDSYFSTSILILTCSKLNLSSAFPSFFSIFMEMSSASSYLLFFLFPPLNDHWVLRSSYNWISFILSTVPFVWIIIFCLVWRSKSNWCTSSLLTPLQSIPQPPTPTSQCLSIQIIPMLEITPVNRM